MLPRISEASVSRPAGDKPRRSLVSVENAIQASLIWPEKVGRKPEPRSKSSSTGSLFRDVKVEAADGIGGVFDTVDTYQHVVFPRLEDAARQRGLTGARKTGWESSVTPSSKPVPLVPPSPIDAAEIHAAKSKLDHLWLVSAVDHQARVEAAYKSKPKRGHKAKAGGKKSASKAVSGNVAVGSRILETLARVEAREHMAALKIQVFYRRYLWRTRYWKRYAQCVAATVKIQSAIRGWLARRNKRQWLRRRMHSTVKIQSAMRSKLARVWFRREKRFLDHAALDIQRVWRSYAARRSLSRHRQWRAATQIQRVWRGSCARARVDKLWLDKVVTRIQAVARGWLCQKKFNVKMEVEYDAAVMIQAMWRGHRARLTFSEALWDRETQDRQVWIRMLQVDAVWHARAIHTAKHKQKKDGLLNQLEKLQKDWVTAQKSVHSYEFDLVNLQAERVKLSPRGIEQGWMTELEASTAEHRKWVTDAKARGLFQVARELRSCRNEYERQAQEIADLDYNLKLQEKLIEQEKFGLMQREKHRKLAEKVHGSQASVCRQRDRWKVEFFTEAGKPDLKRRDGRRMDPEDFPFGESKTVSGGMADLSTLYDPMSLDVDDVALIEDEDGSAQLSRLSRLAKTVETHIAMREMVQYGETMKPLFTTVDTMIEAATQGKPLPKQEKAVKRTSRKLPVPALLSAPVSHATVSSSTPPQGRSVRGVRFADDALAQPSELSASSVTSQIWNDEDDGDSALVVHSDALATSPIRTKRAVEPARPSEPLKERPDRSIPWGLLDEVEAAKAELERARRAVAELAVNESPKKSLTAAGASGSRVIEPGLRLSDAGNPPNRRRSVSKQ